MENRSLAVLSFIKNKPGCSEKDIQEYLKVSRVVLSVTIRSLEELELIRREIGKGRSFSFYITGKGEKLL